MLRQRGGRREEEEEEDWWISGSSSPALCLLRAPRSPSARPSFTPSGTPLRFYPRQVSVAPGRAESSRAVLFELLCLCARICCSGSIHIPDGRAAAVAGRACPPRRRVGTSPGWFFSPPSEPPFWADWRQHKPGCDPFPRPWLPAPPALHGVVELVFVCCLHCLLLLVVVVVENFSGWRDFCCAPLLVVVMVMMQAWSPLLTLSPGAETPEFSQNTPLLPPPCLQ